MMSNRELAKNLIDQIPETGICLLISYMQNMISDETPNAETLDAMAEVEEMIMSNSGQHFEGTAEDFTNMLLSED